MSAKSHDARVRRQRVDEVIAAYLEAVDSGEMPDPQDVIAEHSDIGDELATYFSDCDRFERWAQPLHSVAHQSHAPPFGVSAATQARYFGDYELLEEIARGGMGVVFKARQVSLNRIVAIKMILAGRLASPEDVQRFRAEAEAAANLDHPGIVPIYEVGDHDGQHFFSMGYVDGPSLADRLRDGPLPSRQAAMLLKQVCDAVQFAHENDVVHRDLKPANILLPSGSKLSKKESRCSDASATAHDIEFPIDTLQPKITDFGLAKRLKRDSGLTDAGQIIGTPNYMSPEQASGATDKVGPASDIYSLGAILYQMLTGRPPFQAESPLDALTQLKESDPLPPRSLKRNVPRDLAAVCMQCLEKEPSRRYPSARKLGDDLQRFVQGEAIHASGANLLDGVTRALRHSRYEEQFRGWGSGLMAFGLVILLSHVAIFVIDRAWQESTVLAPWAVYLFPRSVLFAALLIMLWRFRYYSVLPKNSAERLIWVVWTGYLLALAAVNAARFIYGHDHSEVYAFSAVLAGFGFLVMGGHVWGGGYVVGLVFMIAAPLLALLPDVAPLGMGALWAGALFTFGLHYWRRGRVASRAGNL